jgi:hypothetical protein
MDSASGSAPDLIARQETGGRSSAQDRIALVLAALVTAACALVVLAYLLRAWKLIGYPWDWSPDEGLHLDYARRLLEDPRTLYGSRVVPFPSFYGPLLPALLAPLLGLPSPLSAARVLALGWTLAGTAAVAVLAARPPGALWAAAATALYLVPFDLTFWHMLLRTDGLMMALWLWAAVALLPADLSFGGDRLSTRRLLTGASLVIAAALAKPTALVHAAPLVAGWFVVDRRSAWRLSVVVGAVGLAVLAALQVATHGGFLWVNSLWALHSAVKGQGPRIAWYFLALVWPTLTLALVVVLASAIAGRRPLRNPAWLLVLGGLGALPMLGKHGAGFNYLMPLYAGLVLVATTSFDVSPGRRRSLAAAALAATALLALALAATRYFPTPSKLDERTARAFYGFTETVHRQAGGPFLVSSPDLVYFLAGQAVEIEGTSFVHLVIGRAPGADDVLRRLQRREYSMVVETWRLPQTPEWTQALRAGYRNVGGCRLGWYFGSAVTHVHLRKDLPLAFEPPSGTRCAPAGPGSSPEDEVYR